MTVSTPPPIPMRAPLPGDVPVPLPNGCTPATVVIGTPTHTLLADGDDEQTPLTSPLTALPDQVADALHQPGMVAAGLITFDAEHSRLALSSTPRWSAPLLAPYCFRCRHPSWTITPDPEPAAYLAAVRRAQDMIATGPLRKVVLARSLRLEADRPLTIKELLAHLPSPNARYIYAAPTSEDASLIGASPELLVSRHGRMVATTPMAGSARRSFDPTVDQARALALQTSGKDLHEHRLVVDAVAQALAPFCEHLYVPTRPQVTATPTMWHLSTPITGRLRDPSACSLTLAAALHPTPAVCGSPESLAREVIDALEPVDRGFYAGLVGWQDAAGDGEWALALRCGVVSGTSLRLYAGAGIVADSDPEAELAETSAKFSTLLRALRVHTDL
ncbi:isochorismate synthase [Nonomuraea cavernae]|uniref:isochorismate synthase n=1 Tax=Nonomuraea cavernae TaxID=2045107 RepID=A0A917ZDJ5_9ACTN|nr:isochorismate synthase [Nonomuraea cavernae]MCA2190609.1 isochorismate synthase [Nonomuraea cavernae]GGO81365.1 isochorismate synthase DhbC [Nonomuraea cavernae]